MVNVHEIVGLRLAAPSDPERLRDPFSRPAGERRLPYWARVWPSSVVLARLVAGELAERVRGKAVIELGCGLGAAGMTAARAGGDVTLTDGEPEAMVVAVDNARTNGVTVQVAALEWERVPEAMVGRFDIVLAADVAYDRAQVAPLAGAIHALLVPGGEAWITDPGRLGQTTLFDAAVAAGLDATLVRTACHPDGVPVDDYHDVHDIQIYRFVRR